MTEVSERDAATPAPATTAPATTAQAVDILTEDTAAGRNIFYAGAHLAAREGDGSLRPRDRVQHPVPPNSLLWKYMGDPFVIASGGQRTAIIENMWPQLGQGVSDHSVVVSSTDPAVQLERAKSSQKTINGVLYAAPEDAQKYGIQVRNFHKSIKGDMPNGRTYHALNPETFYWAHVTFFEAIFRASEMGVFGKKLSRAEKEQIFEESKDWWSLFGVDSSAQPETYDEFEAYLANVFDNELINSKLAQYTVGLARRELRVDKFVPAKYHWFAKPLAPRIAAFTKMFTVGALEPQLRDVLELNDVWTEKNERGFRRFITFMRTARRLLRVTHAPLKYRYTPAAVAAFEREGINPDDITLESARAALAQARAQRATATAADAAESRRAGHGTTAVLEVPIQIASGTDICAKCTRTLEACEECTGTGHVDGDLCEVCNGAQFGCSVHHADWRTKG